MLNILFNPKRAERHPVEMMIIAIFYSSISIVLSLWIFPEHSSLVMVFFTVLSCVYVIQRAMKIEEAKERPYKSEKWILKEHSKLILFLLFLFLGYVFSFTFWALVLPEAKISIVFNLQSSVVEGIRTNALTGNANTGNNFFLILINNFKVLLFSLIFAFFYGAGSLFVLVWNASVMGFVIGSLARENLGIISLPVAFARYFLHGIPEMIAYLTAVVAGGIIYIAVWRGDFLKKGRLKKLFIDTILLVSISIVLLIIAAAIEVFISPFI